MSIDKHVGVCVWQMLRLAMMMALASACGQPDVETVPLSRCLPQTCP